MYRIKPFLYIICFSILLFSCNEKKTVTSLDTEESMQPIDNPITTSNYGYWTGLDYKSFVPGTSTEKSVSTICNTEVREYRMEWSGSGQPDNFRWYAVSTGDYLTSTTPSLSSNQDLLFSWSQGPNPSTSDPIILWGVAYDNDTSFNDRSKRGYQISLTSCSGSGGGGGGGEPCSGTNVWCNMTQSCIGATEPCVGSGFGSN